MYPHDRSVHEKALDLRSPTGAMVVGIDWPREPGPDHPRLVRWVREATDLLNRRVISPPMFVLRGAHHAVARGLVFFYAGFAALFAILSSSGRSGYCVRAPIRSERQNRGRGRRDRLRHLRPRRRSAQEGNRPQVAGVGLVSRKRVLRDQVLRRAASLASGCRGSGLLRLHCWALVGDATGVSADPELLGGSGQSLQNHEVRSVRPIRRGRPSIGNRPEPSP